MSIGKIGARRTLGIAGFFLPIIICFGAPVPFVAGLMFDRFDSYDLAFMAIATMVALASICAWFLYPPPKKQTVSEERDSPAL